MNETFVMARHNSVCAEPYQYYQCSKGPFEGCCAVNPCDDGICREQDQAPSSSSLAAVDDSQSQTTTLIMTETIMSTASVTLTTVLAEMTSAASIATTLVTSAGYSVVSETVGVLTSTAVGNKSSNTVDGVSSSSSFDHRGAIIGGVICGVVGGLLLLLGLYLWYRKRKALKNSTSWGSNEKEVRKRGSAGLQVNSDYTSSSSWTGPFEHYNDRHVFPFRHHINRTRSSILSELDSSPVSPLTHAARIIMTSSDTIFELDSVNNHKHELEHTRTHSSNPEIPTYPMSSTSSRYSEHGNRSGYSWNSVLKPDCSYVSSGSAGGVKLASAGHPSRKSDTHFGWYK